MFAKSIQIFVKVNTPGYKLVKTLIQLLQYNQNIPEIRSNFSVLKYDKKKQFESKLLYDQNVIIDYYF